MVLPIEVAVGGRKLSPGCWSRKGCVCLRAKGVRLSWRDPRQCREVVVQIEALTRLGPSFMSVGVGIRRQPQSLPMLSSIAAYTLFNTGLNPSLLGTRRRISLISFHEILIMHTSPPLVLE